MLKIIVSAGISIVAIDRNVGEGESIENTANSVLLFDRIRQEGKKRDRNGREMKSSDSLRGHDRN